MESKNKQLRSGYTTGACAAAAAKAATLLLVRIETIIKTAEIPFPDGSRVTFKVRSAECGVRESGLVATASVIKDAGDDPDITNGAEIVATVRSVECGTRSESPKIIIKGGKGVGTVTKPGLAIPVGEPAINLVPRKMIVDAVMEAVSECDGRIPHSALRTSHLEVTISVPRGEALAKKTLNHRLGIVGGISILGTTGIVKPLSEAAWTATIAASFDVAKALGLTEVVLSTGRTSEKAHQQKYGLPEEAYAMMGDHTEFSLREARKRGFRKVHLCAQWAKMIKIAMATPQTHVRHGALEAEAAAEFLRQLGMDIPRTNIYNTSREIYEYIIHTLSLSERDGVRVGHKGGAQDPFPPDLPLKGRFDVAAFIAVCDAAKAYCERLTEGTPVSVHLVSYEGEIVAESA